MSILWIDDDYDIIGGLMTPLKREGYDVKVIGTKKEYLETDDEIIRSAQVIVLDILLPEGFGKKPTERYTGLSILKDLRVNRKLNVPIFILSVVRNDDLNEELNKYNVVKILQKPMLPSELKEELLRVI